MAISPLSAVHRTPVELWWRVFDSLTLRELIVATRVCRRWKAVIFDHPGFWRTVRVDSLSPHGLYWAGRQVEAARERAFELIVDIKIPLQSSRLSVPLLALLRFSIPRVAALNVTVSLGDAHLLWDALRTPAPRIKQLALHLYFPADGNARALPVAPVDLFAGQAANLEVLLLKDIAVPVDPVLAFAGVTCLSLSLLHDSWMAGMDGRPYQERWQDFPDHVFALFPELEILSLAVGGCRYADNLPDYALRGAMRLKRLRIDMGHGMDTIGLLSHLPTSHLRDLTIVKPADCTVKETAGHLAVGSSYGLSILPTADGRHLQVCLSDASNKRRFFVEPLSEDGYPPTNLIFRPIGVDGAFATQFRVLAIATSLWDDLARLLPAYPELRLLVVGIDDDRLPAASKRRLRSVPRLARVVVRCRRTLLVDAKAMMLFLAQVTSARVDVQLENVFVEGPLMRELSQAYNLIG